MTSLATHGAEGLSDGSLRPSTLLGGRYRVEELIGSGGMSEVYRCRDEQLARDVAVKVFLDRPDELAEQQRRLETEVRVLGRAQHENLVTIFDAQPDGDESTDGRPYLVMEYVRGRSLAEIITSGLRPDALACLAAHIAGALGYVHDRHVVHRDITPTNILVGDDGRTRLSDFGVALLPGDDVPVVTAGTPAYLSPEQIAGRLVGPASDIYSLALVLIESITGRRCFPGPAEESALMRLIRAPALPKDLPRPWDSLLAAMTAMDPRLRPSARQVVVALREGFFDAAVPIRLLGRHRADGDEYGDADADADEYGDADANADGND